MSTRAPRPKILRELPLDRHTLVEASAGTGKTFTLENLVVELLLTAGAELESILVVTYTERAAAELRARLRAKLRELLELPRDAGSGAEEDPWILDEAARSKLHRALVTFDLATITTIHAFCQQVLQNNAFASRRLFEQRLVDGHAAFQAAFSATLRRSIAREPRLRAYLDAWLAAEPLDGLEGLLHECHNRRGAFSPAWSEGQLTRALERLAEVQVPPGTLALQLTRLKVHGGTKKAIVDRYTALLAAATRHLAAPNMPRLLGALVDLDATFLVDRLPERTQQMMDPAVRPAVEALVEVCRAAVPLASATVQTLLPVVEEELARQKAEEGTLDFDDMLRMLWESLEGTEGESLARSMRTRHRFALVDEFQDTDDIQWKIFRRVFTEGGGGNVLYLIGDPKQAIYAFRGADVYTYLEATDHVRRGGGARVTLTESYRAVPDLVAGLNFLLDERADPPFFSRDGAIHYHTPVTAARVASPSDLPGPPIRLLQPRPVEGEELDSAGVRRALGAWIAEEVTRLLSDREHPLSPSEIFVLTRTAREGVEAGAHLRRAHIPVAFYKQEGLFQTDEARDILALLTAIADPRSQSRRFRAWIGPFFAVPIEALPACVDLPATHPLLARLFEWSAIAARKDYDRLFTRILEDSGIIRRELFLEEDERKITNYLHIFELLLEVAHRTRPGLEALAFELSRYVEERSLPEGENGNVQRLESERAAVQIMTMHKAKGLEARVVFLLGGLDRGQSSRVHVFHEGSGRFLEVGSSSAASRREEDEEGQRLLYVAATRAKERLYVPHLPGSRVQDRVVRAIRLDGLYRHLNQALDRAHALLDDPEEPRARWFSRVAVDTAGGGAAPASRATPASLSQWTPPAELLAPAESAELAELRAARRGWFITSYSRLKADKGGYVPPELAPPPVSEDELADDRGLPPDAAAPTAVSALLGGVAKTTPATDLPGGTSSGRFLHEVLEKLPLETVTDSATFDFWAQRGDVKAVFLEAMKNHGRDPRHLRHSQELVYAALTAPLPLGSTSLERGIAGAGRIVREMEFLYPIAAPGFIKGYIDLVFEHAGRIYLLDWKSDLLPSYSPEELEVHVGKNYALQAELYTLALVKMLGVSDRASYERRLGGTLYCFVRGMSREDRGRGVYYTRPTWAEIAGWAERLERGETAPAPEAAPPRGGAS